MYGSVPSVITDEVILPIRLRDPALELCRMKYIRDRERATLETFRILLPPGTHAERVPALGDLFRRAPRPCALLQIPPTTPTAAHSVHFRLWAIARRQVHRVASPIALCV